MESALAVNSLVNDDQGSCLSLTRILTMRDDATDAVKGVRSDKFLHTLASPLRPRALAVGDEPTSRTRSGLQLAWVRILHCQGSENAAVAATAEHRNVWGASEAVRLDQIGHISFLVLGTWLVTSVQLFPEQL